jgi:hypothetical protein
MSDAHTLEGQEERARRLRQQIEQMQSGSTKPEPEQPLSLREQIEKRANEIRQQEERGEKE